MEYSTIEELLNNDTIRVNVDLSKRHLERLDAYVKKNMMSNRKKLLEMIIIKFVLDNTEEII